MDMKWRWANSCRMKKSKTGHGLRKSRNVKVIGKAFFLVHFVKKTEATAPVITGQLGGGYRLKVSMNISTFTDARFGLGRMPRD